MSPDVAGALEGVVAAVVLGGIAVVGLRRTRAATAARDRHWAELGEVARDRWVNPQRIADASGVDREITARFLDKAALAHGEGHYNEAARYRRLATGRSWAAQDTEGPAVPGKGGKR